MFSITEQLQLSTLQLTTVQLEYLVAVADASTWADAAAELGVSPSALSQGLGQLERRLGVRLFERDGRRRLPRAEAEPVFRYARSVVAQTRDLAQWSAAVAGGASGALRIGMIDLAATAHFGPTLQRFRRDRPDVELHLTVAPSATLSDQVLAGTLSLAVVVEAHNNTGDLALTPLLEEPLAVYGSGDDWGPWVTFPAGSHTRDHIARHLQARGVTFDVVAESHQPEVLRSMVALGMGWTVLPVIQAEAEPNPLRRVEAEPLLTRRLVVARRFDAIDDPIVDALLDAVIGATSFPG